MSRKTNLLGQHFGDWTVIAEAPSLKTPYKTLAMWLCQCKCGLIKEVRADDLRNGRSKKCKSCAAKENALKRQQNKPKTTATLTKRKSPQFPSANIIDETGNEYPYFTVLGRVESNKRGAAQWLCKCHCGNTFVALGASIRNHKTVSCGCISESAGEAKIKQILIQNNICFQQEYTFDDLIDKQKLRFDFAIFDADRNLIKLIEYQGQQHYENVPFFHNSPKEHDAIKQEYCKKHGIELLAIPYWNYNKIDIDYLLKT